jgi:hypothetical protein
VVHALPYVAVALILFGATVAVFRIGNSDPDWEERWGDLDPSDRTRIKASVESGALLADPEEIELAAGLARRSRSGVEFGDIAAVIVAGLGVALIVAGLAADLLVLVVFGGLFLLVGLFGLRTELQLGRNLRDVISRARGV